MRDSTLADRRGGLAHSFAPVAGQRVEVGGFATAPDYALGALVCLPAELVVEP